MEEEARISHGKEPALLACGFCGWSLIIEFWGLLLPFLVSLDKMIFLASMWNKATWVF